MSEVAFGYKGKLVIGGVDLQIHEGELIGIAGGHGTGKSTLLKGLLGLVKPLYGQIQIFGFPGVTTISKLKRHLGYVPQAPALDWRFPVVVREVVLMGKDARLGLRKRPLLKECQKVERLLVDLEIGDLSTVPIQHLSDEELRRMLIARALATEPRILCVDQPTAALDEPSEVAILDLLAFLVKSRGLTVVLVGNDQAKMLHRADRVVSLDDLAVNFG